MRRDAGGHVRGILPFTIARVRDLEPIDVAAPEPEPAVEPESQETLLEVAVGRMDGHGPAAHQVWLPPLDVPDTLDDLMGDLTEDPQLGLVSPQWRELGGLTVPLGTVDRPREQRRDTLSVNLSGAAGHVAVVGGPRSGKSTMLRTIVTSMSLTTTPLESQFFVLDFGGGTFAPLAALPHVAGVGTRSEPDVVRRVVAEVAGVVDRREAYFRANGIDSIETYRRRRATGRADDGWGDVFLVIDGWSTLRADFDDLEQEIQQLASRGLTFGLHIVTGTARWADFRAAMRDLIGTRLELKLGDAMDSEIDRKVAQLVPSGRPGRGLVKGKLHFLGALPRIDGDADADSLGEGVEDLVAELQAAWTGPTGPKLRLLPEQDRARRRPRAGRRDRQHGRGRPAHPRHQREGPRRRSASTPRPSRTCCCSATAARARAPSCAPSRTRSCAPARPSRRSSWWSTTAARCWARCRRSTCSTTSPRPPRRNRRSATSPPTSRAASPAPTSPPSSCAAAPGGPGPRCTCSSTTTTSWPPSRAHRWRSSSR